MRRYSRQEVNEYLMNNKVYVGNLPYSVRDEELKNHFAQIGEITSATVIMDRRTNRSKGFGFVEFANAEDANRAIEELNGKDLDGRELRVSMARPRQE